MKFLAGLVFFVIVTLPMSHAEQPFLSNSGVVRSAPATRVFRFRLRDEPETLDWHRAHTAVETDILMNIMEGLVTFNSDLKIVPALAESWSISQDGKTYLFKLRRGVQWSDGVVLRAQDFVYSWKRLLSPLTAAPYYNFLFDVEGAQAFSEGKLLDFSQVGVKALDDSTLQVKLTQPVAHWIYIPAFWVTFPMRKDIVDKYGSGWETPGRMVNLGPYSLASHDLDSKIVLKANPHYYGNKGNVEEIQAWILKDDTAALTLFEAGQLDFLTDLGAVDQKKLVGRSDLKILPHLKTSFLGFVVQKYPVSRVKLRQAFAMALDRVKLNRLLQGNQPAASSFVPPGMTAYSQTMGLPYNPERARSELAMAGYGPGNPLTLDFLLPNWDKAQVIGEFIKSELKKNLSVEINLQSFDNKAYLMQLGLHSSPLFYKTWTADYPDPDNFMSLFLSTSGNSETTWKNDTFDQKIQAARLSQNEREREKIYQDMQKLLIEQEAVMIPLYYEPNLALMKARVQNVELNRLDYLYLRKVNVVSP